MNWLRLFCLLGLVSLSACSQPETVERKDLGLTFELPAQWVMVDQSFPLINGERKVCHLANGSRKALQLYEQTTDNQAVVLNLHNLKRIIATNGRSIVSSDSTANGFGLVYQTSAGVQYPVYVFKAKNKTFRLEPHPNYQPSDLKEALEICKNVKEFSPTN